MRNKNRLEQRDQALIARYRELYDVNRKRHDDVIKQLADEFYIDPETVCRVIKRTVREKSGK